MTLMILAGIISTSLAIGVHAKNFNPRPTTVEDAVVKADSDLWKSIVARRSSSRESLLWREKIASAPLRPDCPAFEDQESCEAWSLYCVWHDDSCHDYP